MVFYLTGYRGAFFTDPSRDLVHRHRFLDPFPGEQMGKKNVGKVEKKISGTVQEIRKIQPKVFFTI
jgi:hypothetical protein